MKGKIALFALVAAAAVLVPVLAVLAQQPVALPVPTGAYSGCSAGSNCPTATCSTCSKSKETTCDNAKVVTELMAILKDTKSPETFLLTATTLCRLGGEAKRALPAIIRNAERLELLDGLLDSNTTADNREAAQAVFEAIEMILDKKGGGKRSRACTTPAIAPAPAASYGYAPLVPAVPGTIAPAAPGSTYNAPTPSCCPAPLASPPMPSSSPSTKPKKGTVPATAS